MMTNKFRRPSRESSPESLGSGAMSESDSDAQNEAAAPADEDVVFPLEGKFHSEKDKAEIMAMSEIKREEILAERAQEAERRLQNLQLRRLLQAREKNEEKQADKKRKAGTAELDDSPRKSNRTKVKTASNLEAYKRQREQRNEERKRGDDITAASKKSPSQENGVSDADAEGDSDVEWDEMGIKPSTAGHKERVADLAEINRARVGRSNLQKVCFTPGFEEAMKGCFCRVSVGMNKSTGLLEYRMTQIKGKCPPVHQSIF